MKIQTTKTRITKEGKYENDNALYNLEYTYVDNKLISLTSKVNAKRMVPVSDDYGIQTDQLMPIYLGDLIVDNGSLLMKQGFPFNNDFQIYCNDLLEIYEYLKSNELD